jgi:hypothetical protein
MPSFCAAAAYLLPLVNAGIAQRVAELKLNGALPPTFDFEPLDGQDLNNCTCEFDKCDRIIERDGKVIRPYKPYGEPKARPARKKAAKAPGSPPEPIEAAPAISVPAEPAMAPEPAIAPAEPIIEPSQTVVEPIEAEPVPDFILADMAAKAAEPKAEARATFTEAPVSEALTSTSPPGGSGRKANRYPHGERDTGKREAFYIYREARERFYLGVKRTTTKQFPQYHWDGKQWVPGLPNGFAKIPYRLPELIDAPYDRWVVIAAGEKDAETAVRLGFVATTNPGGDGKGQWTPELNPWFGRRRVAIMEDNDKAGHAHAAEVANALRGIAREIRVVQFRELKAHGDLTDWIEADSTRGHAELLARIEAAAPAVGYELLRASAVPLRAVQWHWPGHIARGELEILTGIPDIGKSQIHCSYIAHMTTGRDWPDKAKGPPACDVVMLTAEDNAAHTVCPRLAAAGANLDRVHILNKIRKDNKSRMFLLQEDLDVLEHILANNPAIGLVTIDPITAYLGGKLDSHRATDVRNQLGPLKELAERSDVAFSAITHPAKRPGPKALDHYIGSQAFIAAPRLGHIAIPEFEEGEDGKPKPTGRCLFATPKHNIYVAMPTLAYRLVAVSAGVDAATGEAISISRVEWAEEVGITADQALAAGAEAAKAKSAPGAVTFLLDILANGPVAKTVIQERASQRGFTEDQLRRARAKAGVVTFKETGKKDGRWFWAKEEHAPANPQPEPEGGEA